MLPSVVVARRVTEAMDMGPKRTTYLPKVIEGLWMVSCNALGEDHLLTLAFETSLRTGDEELMARALALLSNSPVELQRRILWGKLGFEGKATLDP